MAAGLCHGGFSSRPGREDKQRRPREEWSGKKGAEEREKRTEDEMRGKDEGCPDLGGTAATWRAEIYAGNLITAKMFFALILPEASPSWLPSTVIPENHGNNPMLNDLNTHVKTSSRTLVIRNIKLKIEFFFGINFQGFVSHCHCIFLFVLVTYSAERNFTFPGHWHIRSLYQNLRLLLTVDVSKQKVVNRT